MAIQTRLCEFTTADGETLHGLLFQPASGSQGSDLVLLLVHGTAMNFYIGPLPVFGQALAERGYHAFTMNTRGHDWIARAGKDLTAFGGATYENFDDCLLDLDAALESLRASGYRRFVLVGHSLGAVKSLFYQGTRQRKDVVGVISCSAPKLFYSARAADQPEFGELMARAERLVASGQDKEFLWAPSSGALGLFTACTYVSKYGRHEKDDVRPHAGRLGCRLLAIAGGAEHPYFPSYARELASAAGTLGTCRIIEGSEHFYWGYEPAVIHVIAEWLAPIPKEPGTG